MQLQESIAQIKTIYAGLNNVKKITLFSVIGGVVIGLAAIIVLSGRPDYQILFSGLSAEDSGAMITQLKAKKIPYRISSNGGAILIPKEIVYETRMELASQGLPQGGGVGFEIFDNSKLGMTEFVQNVNYQRAIQGELSRTINRFEEIESSRVHLVMPPRSLFIENEEPARASVVIKLRPKKTLSPEQIQGIIHLISSSVAGLKPENVTIVDSMGNQIGAKKQKTDFESVRAEQHAFQEKVEQTLETRVKTMLENALGPNKAIVRLSSSMDFKKLEKTEEKYYPENKVVRSEQISNETSTKPEKTAMGVPGSTAAVAEKTQQAMSDAISGNTVFQKQHQTTNYEIGKSTSHTVEPIGQIASISVAVLVDGAYKTVVDEDGKSKAEYVPRTPEEIAKIKSIVMRAVNYTASRGDEVEVVNIPFENPELVDGQVGDKGWTTKVMQYSDYIKYAFSAVFMVLTFIFIIRPLIQWLTGESQKDAELIGQLPRTINEIEGEYVTSPGELPISHQLSQLAIQDNQAFVEVLREWMKQS
jgi:flagellar M-ring protein FliF